MGNLRTKSVSRLALALCILASARSPAQTTEATDATDATEATEYSPSIDLALTLLEGAHPGVLLVAENSTPEPPDWLRFLDDGGDAELSPTHQLSGTLPAVPYGSTTFSTSGHVQSDASGSWSVHWSSTLSQEDSDFLWGSAEEDGAAMGLSDLYVQGRVGPYDFRAGRYQPERFSAVGRVDAVQGELSLNQMLSTGVVAGFQATDETDVEDTRSLAVAYLAAEISPLDTLQYSGSLGFLSTGYDGNSDRFALLVEQQALLSRYLSLKSNSEIDLYMLSESGTDDFRVTALQFTAESPVTSFLTLRAGVDHSKRPDTRSERATAAATDERAFEEGTWRHWIGGTQKLPWNLELSGELSFEDSYEETGRDDSWMLSLQRKGLLLLEDATISATFFTQDEGDLRGYRGTIAGNLPLLDTRLSVRPSVTMTLLEPGDRSVTPKATDMSIHAQWTSNEHLSLFVGSTYNFVETLTDDQAVAEVGIQFYW